MAPAASHHLHPEQLSWLFAAATAASGPGAVAVNPAGFAAAVLDAGLVSSAAHVRRHPTIAAPQRPQYSDYRCALLGQCAGSPAVLRKVAQQLHRGIFAPNACCTLPVQTQCSTLLCTTKPWFTNPDPA